MDPQLDQRLRAIEHKLDENAVMVGRLYRSQRRAKAMRYVYWGIVIALSFVSFALIKPYLSQLGDAYGVGGNSTNTSDSSYSDLLNSIK